MTYKRLDGTTFKGPLFHRDMEIVGLDDGKTYFTVFDNEHRPIYRQEMAIDNNGKFIYLGEEV